MYPVLDYSIILSYQAKAEKEEDACKVQVDPSAPYQTEDGFSPAETVALKLATDYNSWPEIEVPFQTDALPTNTCYINTFYADVKSTSFRCI